MLRFISPLSTSDRSRVSRCFMLLSAPRWPSVLLWITIECCNFVGYRHKISWILHDVLNIKLLVCPVVSNALANNFFSPASYLWGWFPETMILSQDMLAYFWIKDCKGCKGSGYLSKVACSDYLLRLQSVARWLDEIWNFYRLIHAFRG